MNPFQIEPFKISCEDLIISWLCYYIYLISMYAFPKYQCEFDYKYRIRYISTNVL